MENKRIQEIMVPLENYPHIHENHTLRDAMKKMESCKLERGGMPRVVLILDKEGNLVGLVRRRDIMRGLEPDFLVRKPLKVRKSLFDVKLDPNLSEMNFDRIIEGLRVHAKRPVSDVSLPVEATIDYDDHIAKAMYEMVDNNLSILPVLKQGRVVGVVRSVDVFRELALIILNPDELDLG